MSGSAVALVLTADEPAARRAGVELFPGAENLALTRQDLRPAAPFEGRLFAILAGLPVGRHVGLVIPVAVQRGTIVGSSLPLAPGALLAIADHVNLELRGPLTGRWPAGMPRTFPPLTGVYQPADVRSRHGARVYSSGVVAAGVADVRRLSRFEAQAVREGGFDVVSDSLVPAAIVAAHYGLRLAACGLVQAPRTYRE
jgi:hypothetical protein